MTSPSTPDAASTPTSSSTHEHSSTHGHDVLHLLVANPEVWSRDEFAAVLEERFGPNARFHTCSQQGMAPGAFLEFLLARGKIFEVGGKIHADASKICQH